MTRMLTRLAIVALAMIGTAAPPASAQYPPGGEEVTVDETTVVAGEEITVAGEGFTPGSTATVGLDDEVLGSAPVDEQGRFVITVTIPSDAPCGPNTLDITSDAGDAASQAIMIACPPADGGRGAVAAPGVSRRGPTRGAAPGAGQVARTGADVTVGAALAVALLASGAAALYVARRRAGAASGRR